MTGTTTDWPTLNISTNYWVVISPGTPLTFNAPFKYNGVVWSGVDITRDNIPAHVRNDNTGGNLFTARELMSERCDGDTVYGANTTAGISFVANTNNWAAVSVSPWAGARYKNWQQSNTSIRYGLQVIGIQKNPSNTATSTGTPLFHDVLVRLSLLFMEPSCHPLQPLARLQAPLR